MQILSEGLSLLTPAGAQAEVWLIMVAGAIMTDFLFGGRKLLGRIPGPDRLFRSASLFMAEKLDRAQRSRSVRVSRGLIGIILLCPLPIYIGSILDSGLAKSVPETAISYIILVFLVGQKAVWDYIGEIRQLILSPEGQRDHGRYGAARWAVERLLLRLSDGLFANVLVLALGGMTWLLPFRLLSMTLSGGAPSGIGLPKSDYYLLPLMIFQIFALPGAILTFLFLGISSVYTGGGQMKRLFSIQLKPGDEILTRSIAIQGAALPFGLNFRRDPQARNRADNWLGPKDGRARLEARDITKVLLQVKIATLLGLASMISIAAVIWLNMQSA